MGLLAIHTQRDLLRDEPQRHVSHGRLTALVRSVQSQSPGSGAAEDWLVSTTQDGLEWSQWGVASGSAHSAAAAFKGVIYSVFIATATRFRSTEICCFVFPQTTVTCFIHE